MIPVQVHLVLNHVPLVGLVFGLIFSVLGMKRSSPQFYLAGFAHFLGYGCDRHSDCAFRPAICGRPLRIVLAECNRSGSSPTGWNADSSCSPGIVGCKRDNTVQITSGLRLPYEASPDSSSSNRQRGFGTGVMDFVSRGRAPTHRP